MTLRLLFRVPIKTILDHFQLAKFIIIVLEQLHLKIEITVSEPCDVIRVAVGLVAKKDMYYVLAQNFHDLM